MTIKSLDLNRSLIRRAQSGRDEKAFGRLVALYQSKVRNFLLRLCRQHSLADDLAQDVFLIAYKKLQSYRGTGDFGGWLCSIAYRCFLQHRRHLHREQEIHQQYADQQRFDEEIVDSEYFVQANPEQIALERALRQLSESEAAVITLCHSFGYSHSEVATIMDLPLGTVKSHANRGKQKLKQWLSNSSDETGVDSQSYTSTSVERAS